MQFCLVNISKQGRLHKEPICIFSLILSVFPSAEVFPIHCELYCPIKPMFVFSLAALIAMYGKKLPKQIVDAACLIFVAECTF